MELTREEINHIVPIRRVVESYGIQIRGDRCKCPFCRSQHDKGDMRVKDETNITVCFRGGCNKQRGIINFIRDMENCGYKAALDILDQKFSLGWNMNLSPEEKRKNYERQKAQAAEYEKQRAARQAEVEKQIPIERKKMADYIKSLVNRKDAWQYLRGRGICSRLSEKYGVRGCRIKVYKDYEDKVGHFEDAIMIPYSLSPDEVWCWRRSMTSKEFRKTKREFMGEDEPVFNYLAVQRAIDQQKKLFVCESPIDALSAEQLFGDRQVEYISIGGSYAERFWDTLVGKPAKIVGGFDNDDTGDKTSERFRIECENRQIPYQRFEFDKDCKDINDLLKKKLNKVVDK